MEKFKVIIAGSRSFRDFELLCERCDKILLAKLPNVEVVSGGQTSIDNTTGQPYGADYLGEQYAKSRGFDIKRFPADWVGKGRAAGPIRNEQMAQYADALIAFWDGSSRGTSNMIRNAEKYNLPVRIINY